ncbi:MAG TPA: CarD family transcriptional regulator [Firmicutes bacterium]|nr:CarD family transcriptional regulator [Bacillota bacterium]HHY97938.1 CarD family transcriptional regulator [Bacillota bacterium]
MFNVGDKVVYPMHGAGVIEAIEEREVLGERQKYFIMRIPLGEMKVMVPTKTAENVGLRGVISSQEVKRVFDVLRGEKTAMSQNWNKRYRANLEKIKSGDVYAVAEVVRNLSKRNKEKGLSTGERRMLESARHILTSEIVLATGKDEEEVTRTIDAILG